MWLAIWGSYAASLFGEENPPIVGYFYSALGLTAWLLRIAAFAQQRASTPRPTTIATRPAGGSCERLANSEYEQSQTAKGWA
jgi:hypothetical protein